MLIMFNWYRILFDYLSSLIKKIKIAIKRKKLEEETQFFNMQKKINEIEIH